MSISEEPEVVMVTSNLTCRLCLQKHLSVKSMINDFFNNQNLSEIYLICFGFQVTTNLTTSICNWCADNLVRVFNFKNQVESVEKVLSSYLKDGKDFLSDAIDGYQLYEVEMLDENYWNENTNSTSDQDVYLSETEINPESLEPAPEIDIEAPEIDIEAPEIDIKAPKNKPEVLTCCGKIFKSKVILANHNRTAHIKDARYACKFCELKFVHWNARLSHLTLVHEKDRQLSCTYCNRKFYRKDKMDIHIKRHHLKEFNFECPLCPSKFVINRELRQHMQIHAKRQIAKKSIKSTIVNTDSKHLVETTLKCDFCVASFRTVRALTNHRKKDHKKYACKIDTCKETFYDLNDFDNHMRDEHNNNETKKFYKCCYCNLSFSRKDRFIEHQILHIDHQELHKCNICDKVFSKKSIYNIHIKQHKRNAEGIKYICDHCDKSYRYRATLLRHLKNHL